MKSLVDLSVCKNQIRICYSQKVIHVKINLDAGHIVEKFQDGNSTCGNINQSSRLSDLANDFTAHFDQLMVIMSQRIKKDRGHINI